MTDDVLAPIPELSGTEVSKAELAEIFGEPIAAIDNWVRSGCPHTRSGAVRSPLRFDSARVFAWYTIRKVLNERGVEAARVVRLEIERDALATALARKRG